MFEIVPKGQLAILLATYRNIGGKIDYVLVGSNSLDYCSADVHKDAAKLTIQMALQRYPSYREQQATLLMEPEKAQGALISPEGFFSPGSFWVPLEEISTFPYFSQEEVKFYQNDWNVILNGGVGYFIQNYHRAFSYPPYHSNGYDEHEEIWLFPAINKRLFGDQVDNLTIYSWSTDWSIYFIPGQKWWGSFLWTIYSPQTHQLVGVAISQSN